MHTNFHKSAGLDEPSIPEWLYVKPDQVVRQGLAGADRGKRVVIPDGAMENYCLGAGTWTSGIAATNYQSLFKQW